MEAKHFVDLKNQMTKKLNSNHFQGRVKEVDIQNRIAKVLPIESNDDKALVSCVFPLILPLNSNFILVPSTGAMAWCEKKNGDDNSAHIVSCTGYSEFQMILLKMDRQVKDYQEIIDNYYGQFKIKLEKIDDYSNSIKQADSSISELTETIDQVDSQIKNKKQIIDNADIEIKDDFDFKSKNFVIDKDNDRITMVGGDDKAVLGNELKTFLETLIDTVKQIQVITAMGNAPADPSFINQMQQLKTQIDPILSDKVKLS